MHRRVTTVVLVLATSVACSSSTSSGTAAPAAPPAPTSGGTSSSVAVDPTSLVKAETFPLGVNYWNGRFTTSEDVQGKKNVTIEIVAQGIRPAFKPAVITGSPGQVLHVTVLQANDGSAHFQHNFSIDELNIDKDIPKGAGHSIVVNVKLPTSGSLVYYCKYHIAYEQHGGEFLIAK